MSCFFALACTHPPHQPSQRCRAIRATDCMSHPERLRVRLRSGSPGACSRGDDEEDDDDDDWSTRNRCDFLSCACLPAVQLSSHLYEASRLRAACGSASEFDHGRPPIYHPPYPPARPANKLLSALDAESRGCGPTQTWRRPPPSATTTTTTTDGSCNPATTTQGDAVPKVDRETAPMR